MLGEEPRCLRRKVKKTNNKLQQKALSELEAMEREVLEKVDEEQKRFDQAALKLQQQYTELANNFNVKVDKLRDNSGFKLIQQVLNEMYEDNDNNKQPHNDEL
jgi:hypothetical protein